MALPPSINRSDIIGFEISRQFNTVRYTLTSAAQQAANKLTRSGTARGSTVPRRRLLGSIFGGTGMNPLPTVVLTPGDLEPCAWWSHGR